MKKMAGFFAVLFLFLSLIFVSCNKSPETAPAPADTETPVPAAPTSTPSPSVTATATTPPHWVALGVTVKAQIADNMGFEIFYYNSKPCVAASYNNGSIWVISTYEYNSSTGEWQLMAGGSEITGTDYSTPGRAITVNGTPYLALRQSGTASRAMLYTYNGSAWTAPGTQDFSSNLSTVNMGVGEFMGAPYIAFVQTGSPEPGQVWFYNSTSWTAWGGDFCGQPSDTNMLVTGTGEKYVAYIDLTQSNYLAVSHYTGNGATGWEQLGGGTIPGSQSGSSPTMAYFNGMVHLAYKDNGVSNKITVKRFNGSAWETVGVQGASNYRANNPTLLVRSGELYCAFAQSNSGGAADGAAVMKWNGSAWEYIGSPALAGNGAAYYADFTLGDDNNIYGVMLDGSTNYLEGYKFEF